MELLEFVVQTSLSWNPTLPPFPMPLPLLHYFSQLQATRRTDLNAGESLPAHYRDLQVLAAVWYGPAPQP